MELPAPVHVVQREAQDIMGDYVTHLRQEFSDVNTVQLKYIQLRFFIILV